MALSCTISEIKRDRPISRKSRFFRTPALVARIREIPVGILPKGSIRKNRMVWIADRKKSLRIWLLVFIHYTNVLTWRIAGKKFWRRRRLCSLSALGDWRRQGQWRPEGQWCNGVSPGTVQSSLVISVLRDSGVARIWLGLMSSNKSSRRWRLRETESV